MFKILEVGQHISTGENIRGTRLEDWEEDPFGMFNRVTGGDADDARLISGMHVKIIEVSENSHPRFSRVWFKPGKDGLLHLWKANYDSGG